MKTWFIVRVDADSRNQSEHLTEAIMDALQEIRRSNPTVRILSGSGHSRSEVDYAIGVLTRWQMPNGQEGYQKPKHKGWLAQAEDYVKSIFNEDEP